jgi:hypothetical protein
MATEADNNKPVVGSSHDIMNDYNRGYEMKLFNKIQNLIF